MKREIHDRPDTRALQNGGWGAALGVLFLTMAGCATRRVTNPERTATEQSLLSKAVTDAVEPLSFEVLHGRTVYLDDRFFGAPEKTLVLGELRAKLLLSGAQLTPEAKGAEIVLEVRSEGIGIDRYDSIVGIPSMGAPWAAASVPMIGIVTPELAIGSKATGIYGRPSRQLMVWHPTLMPSRRESSGQRSQRG